MVMMVVVVVLVVVFVYFEGQLVNVARCSC